jgi:hypothetical protein
MGKALGSIPASKYRKERFEAWRKYKIARPLLQKKPKSKPN